MRTLTTNYSLEITAKEGANFRPTSGAIPPKSDVAITSLPMDPLDARVHAAIVIRQAGHIPVPHLAARRIATAMELETLLRRLYQEAQVDRLFIISGDVDEPLGPYSNALSLIDSGTLPRYGVKRVGIAGYPEGHPAISHDTLWSAILAKRDLLTAMKLPYEIVTQFCFDADAILDWLKKLRDAGILAPVKIGIAGPATVKNLLRFAAFCGVTASSKAISKYRLAIASLLGLRGPDALVADLENRYQPSQHGDVRLHFCPFGDVANTARWVHAYRRKHSTKNLEEAAMRSAAQ